LIVRRDDQIESGDLSYTKGEQQHDICHVKIILAFYNISAIM
jgi:hypothetical protein